MLTRPSKRYLAPVIWFTGLSGAGKSTLAHALARKLEGTEITWELLDGDEVRTNLCQGLGFSRVDRDTNVARIAYVAHLLSRNGVLTIVSAISPYREAREAARTLIGSMVEVHVAPPLEECIRRDTKGLYARAERGELAGLTGVSDPYEEPQSPELRLDTSQLTVDEGVHKIWALLESKGAFANRAARSPLK